MNILKLVDITKYYGTKKSKKDVLQHISYQFNEKGLYIIKGASGSGKSTLLNVILGFEKPSSGYIVINGKNLCKCNNKDLLRIRSSYATMIYQNCMLLQNFSVIDNLCLPLFIKNLEITQEEAKTKVVGIIKANAPDIDPYSLCRYLSGGQKQRICLLRSIITDSRIILADEPTGCLDKQNGEKVFKMLKKLSKEKLVIVVTHDEEFASQYGDIYLELKGGKLYEIFKENHLRV
ncbi:MAG: ATP-binding cassette domain-containing protein [Bacilli bacterium]